MRNKIALVLTVISFGLLIPGITQPIFKIDMGTKIDANVTKFDMELMKKESSILQTVDDLFTDDRVLVAFLILLFSIIIPVSKGIMLVAGVWTKSDRARFWLHRIVNGIGKWSMADVFVVAIFLAFLSTRNEAQTASYTVQFFGMRLPIKIDTLVDSSVGPGFYYFLAYCIVSIASFQVFALKLHDPENQRDPKS